MTFTKPMTEQEWRQKHNEPPTPIDGDIRDPVNRANMGYYTAMHLPAEPQFQAAEQKAKNPVMRGANFMVNMLGLSDATDTFTKHILRSPLGTAMTGVEQEFMRENVERPTFGQTAGAVLQTGATAAAPAIAPARLGAQMVAGGALGYAYDVGSDLIAQRSAGEVATPGMATAVGIAAPPAIRGAIGAGASALGARTVAQQVDTATPAIRRGAETAAQSAPVRVARDVAEGVTERVSRIGRRGTEAVTERAARQARLQALPRNAQPAVRTGIDDAIIDLATQGDQATRDAMRRMVQMAERPASARPGAGPASVASDFAVDQFNLISQQRRNIGQQIGQMSDNLPQLRNIDVTPTQQTVQNVFRQNGLDVVDGRVVASDNMRVTDEQLGVLNKVWDRITRQDTLSAKNLHELDQWFSSTQRQARMVDKIEDLYIKVPTPDGQQVDVPVYNFLRDAFGQQLDQVAPPNLRDLNRQYRTLSQLTDSIEGTIVRNSNLPSLQTADISNPSALRRMFGEAQSAEDFRLVYEQMDELSRSLGYQGPRADELYYFANRIRDYYPQTIPETGLRGTMGSSIRDFIGSAMRVGEIQPQDQQRALRQLLEL